MDFSLSESFKRPGICQWLPSRMWNHLPLQLVIIIAALWAPTIAEVCIFGENVEDADVPAGVSGDVLIVMSHKAITCDGHVSQWEFWAEDPGKFRAIIVKRDAGGDNNTFTITGINDIDVSSGMVKQKSSFMVPTNDQIGVTKGDMIAVATSSDNDPKLNWITGAFTGRGNLGDATALMVGETFTTPFSVSPSTPAITISIITDPLVVTCPEDVQVTVAAGLTSATVTYPDATPSGGSLSFTTTYDRNSGSTFGLGLTTVFATVTDDAGATAQCSFIVTVISAPAGNSTCHHCYWVDAYNGGDMYQIDPFQGVETKDCMNNLDRVQTLQCEGDCFTHEYVTNPEFNNGTGFIHYIARTCSTSDNPFRITVEPNTCLADTQFTETWAQLKNGDNFINGRHGSLCRCSGDLCNNTPTKEVEIATCYRCSYDSIGLIFSKNLPRSCVTLVGDDIPTIECPVECYSEYYAEVNNGIEGEEILEFIHRSCGNDIFVFGDPDVVASIPQDSCVKDGDYFACLCSGDLCNGYKPTTTQKVIVMDSYSYFRLSSLAWMKCVTRM